MLYSYFFHQLSTLRPNNVFTFSPTLTFSKIQFQFLFRKFGFPPYFISCKELKSSRRFFYGLKDHPIRVSNNQTSNSLLWCHWGEVSCNLKAYNNCILDSRLTIPKVEIIQKSLQDFTQHFLIFIRLYIVEYRKHYNDTEITTARENFTVTYKNLLQLSVEVSNCLASKRNANHIG